MIRLATKHDLDAIDALSVKTIDSMHRKKLRQWQFSYPRKPHFFDDVTHERLYVYDDDGVISGVMALYKENEESYRDVTWLRKHALVVHRLMIDPDYQKLGLGTAMFDYAINMMKTWGYESIKVDTHPANSPMRALLKRLQFQYRGYLPKIHRLAYERISHTSMKKIVILGSPGTGKTTLSRMLSRRLGLKALHLDTVYWLRNWQAMDIERFTKTVRSFMASHEHFVMDGNYMLTPSFEDRLHVADTIILLNYDTKEALRGIIEREAQYKHTYRSDMATGCIEELDQEFLQYVAFFDDKKKKLNGVLSSLAHDKNVLIFNDRRAMQQWLNTL